MSKKTQYDSKTGFFVSFFAEQTGPFQAGATGTSTAQLIVGRCECDGDNDPV
jgi:hypothetical protein